MNLRLPVNVWRFPEVLAAPLPVELAEDAAADEVAEEAAADEVADAFEPFAADEAAPLERSSVR